MPSVLSHPRATDPPMSDAVATTLAEMRAATERVLGERREALAYLTHVVGLVAETTAPDRTGARTRFLAGRGKGGDLLDLLCELCEDLEEAGDETAFLELRRVGARIVGLRIRTRPGRPATAWTRERVAEYERLFADGDGLDALARQDAAEQGEGA